MTMTILPLMYSNPSIKDTLPQRSVIASQSQLCLDNPSSKCTECLTVPRTGRGCLQRAVWREENSLWWLWWLHFLKCLEFQQLFLTSKLFFCLSLMFIPKLTHTFKVLRFEKSPEGWRWRDYFQIKKWARSLCPELADVPSCFVERGATCQVAQGWERIGNSPNKEISGAQGPRKQH